MLKTNWVLTMSVKTREKPETRIIPVEVCIGGIFDLRSSWENGELKESIAKDGILSPITIRPSKSFPGKYEVIDGNRRVRIAATLGIKEVPALVYPDLEDNDALKMAIVTNVARATLTERDQGIAVTRYRTLNPDKTLDTIAIELGMSPRGVRDYIYLAEMEPTIKIARRGTTATEADKTGELVPETARRLATATAQRHEDLEERHKAQIALAKVIKYFPERKRRTVLKAYAKAPPGTTIPMIIQEVEETTKHIVGVELTDEMYSALNHFKKDRNLDLSKALRQLILDGLRHYQYMV